MWKTLLARKLEAVVTETENKKRRTVLASSSTSHRGMGRRTEGPAKVEQTLELISAIFEVLISCDPEMSPPPDVITELSSIISIQNRKPSVCEIALNQPLPNPQLLQLHQQLITCCRFATSLKVRFQVDSLFTEDQRNNFYVDIERNWTLKSINQSTINARLEFITLLLGTRRLIWFLENYFFF